MDTQLVTKQVHIQQWTDMIRERKASGLTNGEWCSQHGISLKTYYYRLKKVKEAAMEASGFTEIRMPATASPVPDTGFAPQITLSIGSATLGISESTPKDLILQMMEILKDA